MCVTNILTGEQQKFTTYEEMSEFFSREIAKNPDKVTFIGHNFINFDLYQLMKLVKVRGVQVHHVVDTFLLSCIFNPSLEGGHSLEDWGRRLGLPKGDFKAFKDGLSDEMVKYCFQDTAITAEVFKRLVLRMRQLNFSEQGIDIEHRAWFIIKRQERSGFAFNIKEAHILYSKLRKIEEELKNDIHKHWPPTLLPVATFKQGKKKDGSRTSNYLRHSEQYASIVDNEDGSYVAYDYVAFDPASPKQRVEKLIELGWQPEEFTKKGTPQPTAKGSLSPSLERFVEASGNEAIRTLADWITVNSRANMINTWLDAYNEKTGCIHGRLFLANTFRYRHSNPNSANIPAVRLNSEGDVLKDRQGGFSYESRDLWVTRNPSTRRMVGVDAKGIQLRVLAHYLNNPDFTKAVLDGDPHSYNQSIGGFRTRSVAKTFIYAFLLGVGDEKAGKIIGGSTRDGREVKSRFISNFPGLRQLLSSLEKQVERTGRIRLCDGLPIVVSAKHAVLGYLLQGDESRIMKQAMILVDRAIRREKLDVIKCGDIHDEWQADVLCEHVDRYIEICEECFAEAGRIFNYRLPIECDAKIGLTWAETH